MTEHTAQLMDESQRDSELIDQEISFPVLCAVSAGFNGYP